MPTTLPEFLDACHVRLSVGFSSRINYKTGTKGKPENAESKLRPNHIVEWTTFPQEQSAIWKELFDVDFVSEAHFTSLNSLREWGDDLRLRSMGSELDLGYFERYTVEDNVAAVIRKLHSNPKLQRIFNLKGNVMFENHGNTIASEERSAGPASNPDIISPDQSPVQKRQKKVNNHGDLLPITPTVRSRSSRPRADQFCVYNAGPEETFPAYIIEYKAPHKFTLPIIETGLVSMDVDDVIIYNQDDGPIKLACRQVAAVITQGFSYMIQAGLEYGYICTGEAFIFLRVDDDDPTTVYYYLSIPNEDVGDTTGWTNGSDTDNRLHLTAIGQVLAFTLRALKTHPRSQVWRNEAESRLKRWEIEHDDILFQSDAKSQSSSEKARSSDYKQPQESRNEYIRLSPIKTRLKAPIVRSSCRTSEDSPTNQGDSDEDDNDSSENDGYDPNSPSAGFPRPGSRTVTIVSTRKSTHKSQSAEDMDMSRPFCTQKCLLGLLNGGALDKNCPNVATHGDSEHTIDRYEFRRLVRAQVLRTDGGEFGCESMHIHGTSGALFKLILFSHGYTLVVKGMPVEMVNRAIYEEYLYRHLRPIQGVNVPVCLGSVDISYRPLWYDGIAEIVHLLFLGHAGRLIKFHAGLNNLKSFVPSAFESLRAIHGLKVLHRDPHNSNMFWNAENKTVMIIDFERAKILVEQVSESSALLNKRKRQYGSPLTADPKFFKWELNWVAKNMV